MSLCVETSNTSSFTAVSALAHLSCIITSQSSASLSLTSYHHLYMKDLYICSSFSSSLFFSLHSSLLLSVMHSQSVNQSIQHSLQLSAVSLTSTVSLFLKQWSSYLSTLTSWLSTLTLSYASSSCLLHLYYTRSVSSSQNLSSLLHSQSVQLELTNLIS